MPDIRGMSHDCSPRRETVCINTYRILDSCKDKDCFEDTKLFLSDYGEELVEKASSMRVASAELVWSDISVSPVKFNKGFYQINIRYYTKLILEACLSMGKAQELEALAVNDKTVVLYGGCGKVSSFRSGALSDDFCMCKNDEVKTTSAPSVVVEALDPVALSVKICEEVKKCHCQPSLDEIPVKVLNCLGSSLCHPRGKKNVYVTLGFFSVIRVEREAQLMITASEYAVPDKVCCKKEEEDPCALFAKMSFPTQEFTTGCQNES